MNTLSPEAAQRLAALVTIIENLTGIEACIAGGAVRDLLLGREPRDWDVFLLGCAREEVEVSGLNAAYQPSPEEVESMPESYLGGWLIPGAPFLRQGETLSPGLLTVQLLVPGLATPEELLDTFDWDICLFAWTAAGRILVGPGARLPVIQGTLHLSHLHAPYRSSLRRGFDFEQRYRMRMAQEDYLELLRSCWDEAQGLAAGDHSLGWPEPEELPF